MQICVLDNVITHPDSSENSLSLLLFSVLWKAEGRTEQEILSFKSFVILQKKTFSQYIKRSPKLFHSFEIDNILIFGVFGLMFHLKEAVRELPWFSQSRRSCTFFSIFPSQIQLLGVPTRQQGGLGLQRSSPDCQQRLELLRWADGGACWRLSWWKA